MKLKGISKLILAGTALAATAATLTTSTYAWYVTNANATATGVQGSVDSTVSGSLYIAKNTIVDSADKPGNYGPSLTLERAGKTGTEWTAADLAQGKYKFDDLQPQSYAKDGVYEVATVADAADFATKKASLYTEAEGVYTAVGEAAYSDATTYYTQKAAPGSWVTTDGSSTPAKFIEFKFWLTADSTADASFLLKVDNISEALIYQKALTSTGLPTTGTNTAIEKDDTFAVDAVYALRMSITKAYLEETYEEVTVTSGNPKEMGLYTESAGVYTLTNDTSAQTGTKYYNKFAAGVAQDLKTIRVSEVAKAMDGSTAYSTAATTAGQNTALHFANADGDANGYFASAMNYDPYNYGATATNKEKVSTGDDALSSIHIEEGKNMLLTFKVWLEGSDSDCFDSCRGQSFKFDFTFGV